MEGEAAATMSRRAVLERRPRVERLQREGGAAERRESCRGGQERGAAPGWIRPPCHHSARCCRCFSRFSARCHRIEGRADIPDLHRAPCHPRTHAVSSSSPPRSADVGGRESGGGGEGWRRWVGGREGCQRQGSRRRRPVVGEERQREETEEKENRWDPL